MRVHRYWQRAELGDGHDGTALGWSDVSAADAADQARVRAGRIVEYLRRSGGHELERWYGYADRPIREPILQDIERSGRRIAALTRNGYGAVVLNAAELFIADVDVVDRQRPWSLLHIGQAIRRLLRPTDVWQVTLDRIRHVTEGRSTRIYRTLAGYRVFVTDVPMSPTSDEAAKLLTDLESDVLYRRLCTYQQCYRARLTPKPWRLKLKPPPKQLRDPSRPDAPEVAAWLERYDVASRDKAVCELVESHGPVAVGDAADLIKLHDSAVLNPPNPLA